MKIAVLIPSRGLVHSRTMESIQKNLESIKEKHESKLFFTHDLPLPDAPNELVKRALKWKADLVCFVEEDMLIPDNALKLMLMSASWVTAVDYPVGEKRCSTIARKKGNILWTGLGCTLIDAKVFKILKKPWFRTDKSFRIVNKNPLELEEQDVPNKYGGHDIWFGMSLNKAKIPIYQIPNLIAGHIKKKKLDDGRGNMGTHEFEIWDKIEVEQDYN
jgi:hypothetical protein